MSILFLVVPIAVLMSAAAVATFFWAVRRGQFDDLVTPSVRILGDDLPIRPPLRDTPQGQGASAGQASASSSSSSRSRS